MSADAITICPACYSRKTGKPFGEITAEDLYEESMATEFREFHEPYIDCGQVFFIFYGSCAECGYHVASTKLSASLPLPKE